MNHIAADVVDCAASRLHAIADVHWIDVEVAEKSGNRAQFTYSAFIEQLTQSQPLIETADHESFADFDAGAGTHVEQCFGFGHREADRLFAQNMLTGLGGLDRPWDVKLVRKRIVDCIDIRVGKQLFIGAVGGGYLQCTRRFPCFG